MTASVRELGYRRHLFGPGDLLTLHYRPYDTLPSDHSIIQVCFYNADFI
jgi:hypothetical protein